MNSERWARIKEIFAVVLEAPPGERHEALAKLCGDDLELKAEVERLLAQHDEMGGFLESSTPAATGPVQPVFAVGEIIAGRYCIQEFLGSGGMGEVYSALDQDLGEGIAIKIIRQETSFDANVLERLRREVQLARRITHPNVCRVFDLGRCEHQGRDVIFLTMELVRGETLSMRLKRQGKASPAESLMIATQLCEALDAAHQSGILHRDFKTSNVMLAGIGDGVRAVVTDFGIARLLNADTNRSGVPVTNSLTRGMVIGTPAYMSPEQLLGEELTAASDIYSLGLVLYEMVTGKRPFQAASSWTETLKRLSTAPKPPIEIARELGPKWNSAILRCLERDPAKRFSSARVLADFLNTKKSIPALLNSRRFQIAAGTFVLVITAAAFTLHDRIWPPALPQPKHVAVLPFTARDTDTAAQATALAESLTSSLSRLQTLDSSLSVVPWSYAIKQKPEDIAHAGSALGVNLLVTGELQKGAGRLRLVTAVRDARSLRQLRSEVVDIPESRLLTLEDSVLEQATSMLELHVPPEVLHHLPVDATTQPGAYDFYEKGRGYLLHFSLGTPEDLDLAISRLQKAIEKDPGFALAYADLAYAYAAKFSISRDLTWIEKAKQECRQALSLDNNLAAAHRARGLIERYTGNSEGAIREFERALQLDPSDDETVNKLSALYDRAGRTLQAEALLKSALKRSPGSWVNYNNLGALYYHHSDYAQAEPLFRTASELAPDIPLVFSNLGGDYLEQGKYQEAESALVKSIAIKPSANAYCNLGQVRQYQHRYLDAASMFQRATELASENDQFWYSLGDAYSLAGEQAKARQAFEKAVTFAEKAVALRPQDASLAAWLSLYYARVAAMNRAREKLATALRFSQNDPEVMFNAAKVYELLRERERALAALRSAVQLGYSLNEVQNASELINLRQDRRYSAIVGNSSEPK